MVIAPHSDDEAIGAGGLLLAARAAGIGTHVVYVTDSAAERVLYAESPEQTVAVREREASAACGFVGAEKHDLGVSCLRPSPQISDVAVLRDLLKRIRPQIVAVPWLLDRPPQHRMCNHILALALNDAESKGVRVLGYQVHTSIFANRYLDIGQWIDRKREMLGFYVSQLLLKRYDHIAIGMAAFNSRFMQSAHPGYAELFHEMDVDAYRRLVFEAYLPDMEATYGARPDVEKAMRNLQSEFTRNRGGL
jgi:LmbE family N-acetylglucosaminyl deacetylase